MSRLAYKVMRLGASVTLVSALLLPVSAGAFVRPDPATIVGRGVQTLKAGWGRPDSKEVLPDGGEVWIYSRIFSRPGTIGPSSSYANSQGSSTGPVGYSTPDDLICETRFEVSADKQVVDTSTTGAGCAIGPARA